MKKIVPIAAAAVIIIGAGAFYGGLRFAEAKKPALGQFGEFQGQRGQTAGAGGAAAMRRVAGQSGGFMNGEIISQDSQSITVKLADGGSKIAFFSTSTEVSKFAAGTLADLTAGTNVMVTGKAGADGSIIAQSIQIRPEGIRGPGAQKAQ